MNTYASHIISFMMLGWVEDRLGEPTKSKVAQDDSNQNIQKITAKGLSMQLLCLSFILNACSCIMVMVTKRELMFPHRTAPKYVFDVAQTSLYLVFTFFYCL
jgi:hypothetical protein